MHAQNEVHDGANGYKMSFRATASSAVHAACDVSVGRFVLGELVLSRLAYVDTKYEFPASLTLRLQKLLEPI